MVSTKKLLVIVALAIMLTLCVCLAACQTCQHNFADGVCTKCGQADPDYDESQRIPLKLNPNSVSLYAGNTVVVQIEGLADGETIASWASADADIATVDSNGVVTAVAVGETTIKATTGTERIALASVTVLDNSFVLVPCIKINETALNIAVGGEYTLQPQLTYGGQAVTGTTSWTSTNPSVATVENGIVKAVGNGSATVVCQASYEGQTTTAKVGVTVAESGYYFCADYANLEIWQGDTVQLSISQTVNGETTQIPNVEYKSSSTYATITASGQLTVKKGEDLVITATFEHDGTTYTCETPLHVYGKHTVKIYLLAETKQTPEFTLQNKLYGEKITLNVSTPNNRTIKCWYINGERINGNTFIMPDADVEARVKLVNETEGDFTTYFSEGALLGAQPEVLLQNSVKKDSFGNQNIDGNYVLITNSSEGGSSVQFNLDEGVVITKTATVILRVYIPSTSVKLYFGVGNTVKRTVGASGADYTVATGRWTDIKVPLTALGTENTLLNNFSIGLTGSSIYIDYIMLKY